MPAFVEWHLYSADIHSSDGLVDPMVVDMKIQGIKVLLQEDLIAVAEGAKGKKPSKRFVVVLFNTGGGGGGGYHPYFLLIGFLADCWNSWTYDKIAPQIMTLVAETCFDPCV